MSKKEAASRLKINKLLEDSNWRLLDNEHGRANVDVETRLNPGQEINTKNAGEDFENIKGGFVDYLLLDNNQKPVAVLEAKRESIPPLSAKEQARNYANGMHVRYVILSNGNVHFLWDMQEGNPEPISKLPTLESLQSRVDFKPNQELLASEPLDKAYIAQSQMPNFTSLPDYQAGGEQQKEFIDKNKLKIMRHYQVNAVHAIAQTDFGHDRTNRSIARAASATLTRASSSPERAAFTTQWLR